MSDHQRTFFDDEFEDDQRIKRGLPPDDPNVHPADMSRLAGQNAAILQRLQRGPVSNSELSAMALKYTSRISDLRAAGYTIVCARGDGGLTWYRLQ